MSARSRRRRDRDEVGHEYGEPEIAIETALHFTATARPAVNLFILFIALLEIGGKDALLK